MDAEKLPNRNVVEMLRAVLAYQLGKEACALLEEGEIKVRLSPATGRIREIYIGGELIGTIRASDGFFVPTLKGATKLLKVLPPLKRKVVVERGAAPFIAQGRTVFCKHVVNADPEIKPGDEVLVVDTEGTLVGVGKAIVSGIEMVSKKAGRAVKVRKGVSEGSNKS